MSDFQCRIIFFPRNSFARFFPLETSLQDIFSEITHNPSKVKWSAPKIHQTFGQLTDSDLSIISKGFWNNRGQNSLGDRGGIRFYLPLPGESVRTDVRWRHKKISRMDSLPNFLTHGAPLRGFCYDRPGESECSPGIGLLLLTVTEVSTTCAVVIFRIN